MENNKKYIVKLTISEAKEAFLEHWEKYTNQDGFFGEFDWDEWYDEFYTFLREQEIKLVELEGE